MSSKPILRWTSFPFIERKQTSAILVIFILLFSSLIWMFVMIPYNIPKPFYFIGMALFFIEMFPYFTKTDYAFFEDKVVVTYPVTKIEKKYSNFKSFYADKHGIMLSTFKHHSKLDRFRGQSIRFSHQQSEKAALLEFLMQKIGNQR